MTTYNIFTETPAQFPQGKADFLLAASVTKTCEIEGITQAGIAGMIPLTPTLDAEYITNAKVFSLQNSQRHQQEYQHPHLLRVPHMTLLLLAALKSST